MLSYGAQWQLYLFTNLHTVSTPGAVCAVMSVHLCKEVQSIAQEGGIRKLGSVVQLKSP